MGHLIFMFIVSQIRITQSEHRISVNNFLFLRGPVTYSSASFSFQDDGHYHEKPTRQNGFNILNCGSILKFNYAPTKKNI